MIPYLGGLISRWHGGGIHGGDSHSLKNFIWSVPFIVSIGFNVSWYASPLGLLCLLKGGPHGRGFRLEEPMEEGTDKEWPEYILQPLFGGLPTGRKLYWYKVAIMALAGLAAVSGAVIAFSFVSIPHGLLFAVGGLFKGINAMIFDKNTEAREFADGVAAYSPLAIIGGVFG